MQFVKYFGAYIPFNNRFIGSCCNLRMELCVCLCVCGGTICTVLAQTVAVVTETIWSKTVYVWQIITSYNTEAVLWINTPNDVMQCAVCIVLRKCCKCALIAVDEIVDKPVAKLNILVTGMPSIWVHKAIDDFVESFKMELLYHLFERFRCNGRHHCIQWAFHAFCLGTVTNFVSI